MKTQYPDFIMKSTSTELFYQIATEISKHWTFDFRVNCSTSRSQANMQDTHYARLRSGLLPSSVP